MKIIKYIWILGLAYKSVDIEKYLFLNHEILIFTKYVYN